MTTRLRTAHTADLTPAELHAARALLDAAFAGHFDDHDWEHGLGGIHALVHDDAGLAAHGSVVMRRMRHRGRWLRVGYVEAVGVRPDARRSGHGGRVMGALERVVDRAYDLGALSASEDGARLYGTRGWQVWPGRISALSPDGPVHLRDEEGDLHVWPALAGPLDPAHELLFDWRDGDVL
ncbi:GNAT family N-acetyltransferase [Streptomyces brasiliensis]|uniref:Aminoglycoside 2'-N-acetyltransferase n=1 Tax=Streptomyces brasiliensis TaxID=1954 RepID=A0A917LAY0_9ACTN|nr:GNAT family N-acetyltransferase [Streptomyces brasiliensis]GGJ57396.1 aminoglycoside 2'-N-acetyltransferase [Streptomyces brasiliensis]